MLQTNSHLTILASYDHSGVIQLVILIIAGGGDILSVGGIRICHLVEETPRCSHHFPSSMSSPRSYHQCELALTLATNPSRDGSHFDPLFHVTKKLASAFPALITSSIVQKLQYPTVAPIIGRSREICVLRYGHVLLR